MLVSASPMTTFQEPVQSQLYPRMSTDHDKPAGTDSNAPEPAFDSETDGDRVSEDVRRARARRVEALRAQYLEGQLRFDWLRVAERMLDRIASGTKHR
ncbi:MAG: flagellar biosynthesis anti-sigma factor FlgM [Gammaproteobacteria bacterium]|nr:flagellar biosynthesis anti-sigma factor FlgM [Gammaproteobacteria bacterium]